MYMDAYIYMKLRMSTQNGQGVFFNVHKTVIVPDHVVRQATKEEKKLQNSHDGKKKWWDWEKYFALHKEQHTIMESLANHGYSCTNDGTKLCHILQGIRSTELEAAV